MRYRARGRPPKTGLPPGRNPATGTMLVYDPEEFEVLKAIDRYKRERHRPHPDWQEVFAVFIGLGYRQVAPPGPLPVYAPPPTEL
jgi:hypothetical protein